MQAGLETDPFGVGTGMNWTYGGEHWCNLEGSYLHIVSDMSHLADSSNNFIASICSLGVMGTKYERENGGELPSTIGLKSGE